MEKASISLRARYAMSGTDIAYGAVSHPAPYGGTGPYRATRLLSDVRDIDHATTRRKGGSVPCCAYWNAAMYLAYPVRARRSRKLFLYQVWGRAVHCVVKYKSLTDCTTKRLSRTAFDLRVCVLKAVFDLGGCVLRADELGVASISMSAASIQDVFLNIAKGRKEEREEKGRGERRGERGEEREEEEEREEGEDREEGAARAGREEEEEEEGERGGGGERGGRPLSTT
eukprot:1115711-Rhodomonas_salina.8